MRIPILVKMAPEERAEIVRRMRDVAAAEHVERVSNSELRKFIIQTTVALKAAVNNPDDEDCQRFLVALRKAIATEGGVVKLTVQPLDSRAVGDEAIKRDQP